MLYSFLKILLKRGLKSYFQTVKVSGKEHIPKSGPILFVANHPSTLMDPIVVGAVVSQELYFLAASEYMGPKWMQRILGRLFNMIPVYRQTTPGKSGNNHTIFEKCIQHFHHHGSILIFPEGTSFTENQLRPLKTGAARLAFSANHQYPDTPVVIIPVGINYTDPHLFQSHLYVQIGAPITVPCLPREAHKHEVLSLTEKISNALRENLIHLESVELESIFEKLATLSKHHYHTNYGKNPTAKEQFEMNKEIEDGLRFYYHKSPNTIKKIHHEIDDYFSRAAFYGLTDGTLSKALDAVPLKDYLKILLGLPFFIVGFAGNAAPYYFTVFIYRHLKIDGTFKGSVALVAGILLYLVWYGAMEMTLANFIGHVGALGSIALVYISGLLTLKYLRLLWRLKQKGRLNNLIRRQRNISISLLKERQSLINQLLTYSAQVPK